MSRWLQVYNRTQGGPPLLKARWCASFGCRLRGLTFRRNLPGNEGLLLVESRESVTATGIHMMAVFMELGVAWLDSEYNVVDVVCAKPWRMYLPAAPARYILEGTPALLERVRVGDQLELVDEA